MNYRVAIHESQHVVAVRTWVMIFLTVKQARVYASVVCAVKPLQHACVVTPVPVVLWCCTALPVMLYCSACVAAGEYILILCNAIGSPVDSKYIQVRPGRILT